MLGEEQSGDLQFSRKSQLQVLTDTNQLWFVLVRKAFSIQQ